MKQPQYVPLTVAQMAITLFAAGQGYLDDVATDKAQAFESALQTYMRAEHATLIEMIDRAGDYNDEIAAGLKSAVEQFKAGW